jgi:hypothetical protein
MRVWAYQYNLENFLGFKPDLYTLTQSADHLPDFWIHYKGKTQKDRVNAFLPEMEELVQKETYQSQAFLTELARRKTLTFLKNPR